MEQGLVTQFEMLLGSVGVILALFFAAFLISSTKDNARFNLFLAFYLLAMGLRIGKSLFHNYFEIDPGVRTFLLSTLLAVGPSLWLYSRSLIAGLKNVENSFFWHYLPLALFMGFSWFIPNDGSPIFGWFYNFLILHMVMYLGFAIWQVWKEKARQEPNVSTSVFKWLNWLLGINLVFVIFYFLISELIIPFYMGISFLFSGVVISLSFIALRDPGVFREPREKYSTSQLDVSEAQVIFNRLKDIMEVEKPFLNPDLSLTDLSNSLGVTSKVLSQVINQSESLNYSQYIARYRVKEAKKLLKQESHAHLKIAAIAYECGFNSISSFNAAFKKHAGVTAVSYRKNDS